MRRIIVVGPPRSGTTWVGKILSATPDCRSVHEPDNDLNDSYALAAKAGIGRFPVVLPGEIPDAYAALWEAALDGGRPLNTPAARGAQVLLRTAPRAVVDGVIDADPWLTVRVYSRLVRALARPRLGGVGATPRSVIVKSVHAAFAIEAVAARRRDATVLVVRRNPLNAVASWIELGWKPLDLAGNPGIRHRHIEPFGLEPPDLTWPDASRVAWDYALMDHALARAAQRKGWPVVHHEDLCDLAIPAYRHLCEVLGLDFTPAVEAAIRSSDQLGDGYETKRLASDQAGRWRDRLDDDQVRAVQRGLAPFVEPMIALEDGRAEEELEVRSDPGLAI